MHACMQVCYSMRHRLCVESKKVETRDADTAVVQQLARVACLVDAISRISKLAQVISIAAARNTVVVHNGLLLM
jgi:hypothetical protein